jgi:L-fuconolactonase
MFGSDWPVCLVAASYVQVVDALHASLPPLSPGELAEVFGGTAQRVYRLPERQEPSVDDPASWAERLQTDASPSSSPE